MLSVTTSASSAARCCESPCRSSRVSPLLTTAEIEQKEHLQSYYWSILIKMYRDGKEKPTTQSFIYRFIIINVIAIIVMCVCSGEVGSGKTTLVAKLQGVEEYMKGRGLEYLYFSVHDDDIDGNKSPFQPYL